MVLYERGEKKPLLKPKYDAVFHALFREGNENITKAMIQAVTKEKIKEIKVNSDRHLIGKYPEEKIGIVDLRATLDNGTICDIEIQLADNKDTAERFLYYWSRIYSGQLISGDEYKSLNKVIGIIILDYEYDKTKEIEDLSTKWMVKEVSTGKNIILTDVLELNIIEIPKARKMLKREPDNKLAQWIIFLDNPNESEVSKFMKEDKEIKEAVEKLEEISEDEELRRLAELKEKAEIDDKLARMYLTKYGREEGIKEGIKQGKKEGINSEKIEVAKRMKDKGMDIELIAEITKLTKEEIDNI